MKEFAEWLSTTAPSVFIQTNNGWVVPGLQSIHIVGIALILGAIFMIDLRILGLAGRDQTLSETTSRFGPWLTGALCLLLATGILQVIGEPVRELVSFSFWLKMALVAISTVIVVAFQKSLRKRREEWEQVLVNRGGIKALTVFTFLIWAFIIILGRLIAYDHVWGSWSPAPKA